MSTRRRLFAVLTTAVLVLVGLTAGPSQGANAPITTNISVRSVVNQCIDVPGPLPCLYESLSFNSSGPDSIHTCLFRDYSDDSGVFDFEYQAVCTELPMSRFVIDTKKWESFRLLPTDLTFTEGDPETVTVEALITASTDGSIFYKGVEHTRNGTCQRIGSGSGVLRNAVGTVSVNGESYIAGASLFAYRTVDLNLCKPKASNAVAPRTTSTFSDIFVWTCNDVPTGDPCVGYGIRVSDSSHQEGMLDLCVLVYTMTSINDFSPRLEYGCTSVPPTRLTLDRQRLESGEFATTTVPVVAEGSDGGGMRDIEVGFSFVANGALTTYRLNHQVTTNGCRTWTTQLLADRQIAATIQLDGFSYASYSGDVSLGDYKTRTNC
jgi:hypothetical protein